MPAYKDTKTNKWYVQFYFQDWTGKRRHKVKRGFERKKDAEQWERDFRSQEHGEELRMNILIEEYCANLDTRVSMGNIKFQSAYEDKAMIRRYIAPYFNNVIVSKIKIKDINKWLESINHHKTKDRRLSSATLSNVKIILKQIFDFGMMNHNLSDNPVPKADKIKPYSPDQRAKYWTLEQYSLFYSSVKQEDRRIAYNLMFFAGLRIGEILALTPADIQPNKVIVDETYVKLPNMPTYYNEPKTETSMRVTTIPTKLYFQIKNYIDSRYKLAPDDKILSCTATQLRYMLNSNAKKLGLPRISPHILRHSYASLVFSKTKDILVVAKQIGHKNASMTYDVYSHMMPGEDKKAADILDEIMLKSLENPKINSN